MTSIFPKVLANLINEYCSEWKLKTWVRQDQLNWSRLSTNPAAIDLLSANPDKIDWEWLSANPAAMDLALHRPEATG